MRLAPQWQQSVGKQWQGHMIYMRPCHRWIELFPFVQLLAVIEELVRERVSDASPSTTL